MAAYIRLWETKNDVLDEYFARQREAEINRFREFDAAVKIQSSFRGWKVRRRMRFLHNAATTIQSAVRGYFAFKSFQELVKRRVFEMRMNFYNRMATLIQSVWRGYYSRKYVHSYYTLKSYLEGVKETNSIVREKLGQYKKAMEVERDWMEKAALETQLREHASKTHYLLSTETIGGIYSSPHSLKIDEREVWLRKTQPRTPPRRKSQDEVGEAVALPPLTRVQGPFRSPQDVQRQKHKKLEPTLKVATDFYAVEKARVALRDAEWVKRVQEKEFFVTPSRHKGYERLLHGESKYGHLAYGTKHFRDSTGSKRISAKDFRTVVSPIHMFDEFNKTY
ncbi:spermatogenesis-associated protein 17-like [Oscarella lobularis]|uniref:spermatogenesis-associated protein 17-like n=1 Tax=Oscarella lobularis TaxID=121494 RepID=UPI0033135A78